MLYHPHAKQSSSKCNSPRSRSIKGVKNYFTLSTIPSRLLLPFPQNVMNTKATAINAAKEGKTELQRIEVLSNEKRGLGVFSPSFSPCPVRVRNLILSRSYFLLPTLRLFRANSWSYWLELRRWGILDTSSTINGRRLLYCKYELKTTIQGGRN